jgi:NAD-specific glutamate dehydrogenase
MVPDVAALSQQLGQPVGHVAAVFFEIDEALPMEYLYRRLRAIDATDQWERWQHRGLHDELRWARRTAAARILNRERPVTPSRTPSPGSSVRASPARSASTG